MSSEELNESELGTQEYWDNRYKTEVNNFLNHGDVGDVWFGEESMHRIIRWILRNKSISIDDKIIDLGCGNGLFLIELAKNDFTNLFGVDYSHDAIVLAKEITDKEGVDIKFEVFNILSEDNLLKYDVVHDKGTYDAISLSTDAKINRKIYIEKVHSMLKDEGFFIITSCNWTKDELLLDFTAKFQLFHIIPTPKFQFGGYIGNSVTTIVFKKK